MGCTNNFRGPICRWVAPLKRGRWFPGKAAWRMAELINEAERQRSFTADKLEWMRALCADPRIDARAFQIGFCIAQHVNRESRTAILSDETIRDLTNMPTRWVRRARNRLRETKWVAWKRTRTANVYWTLSDNLSQVSDLLLTRREARQEMRETRKNGRRDRPPVAILKSPDRPRVATLDRPWVAEQERPQVADIHLSSNTLRGTPSKEGGLGEVVIVERGEPSFDEIEVHLTQNNWERRLSRRPSP